MLGLMSWLVAFFVNIALLVLVGYQMMCLLDLEVDHINPYDSAIRINQVVIPEFVAQGGLFFILLFTGHWLMALICVPYLSYNVKLYMDNRHLVDVTEIFRSLNQEKKKRFVKIGYLLFTLLFSVFWLLWAVLEDGEHY